MKKRTFKIAMIAVVAAVAGYGIYKMQINPNIAIGLVAENVEALATPEFDTPYRVVPCPGWNEGNECKTSNEDRPKCWHLTYCH